MCKLGLYYITVSGNMISFVIIVLKRGRRL